MRTLLILAGLATLAAAAGCGLSSGPASAPVQAGGGHLPMWALFTFAVSAFREPLR